MSNLFKCFFLFLFLLAVIFLTPAFHSGLANLKSTLNNTYGVFSKVFEEKISPEDLREKYEKGKIRILIVPGHDNVSIGGQFQNVKESDLSVELAYGLLEFFQKDSKFQVFITREKNGDYRDWLSDYLEKENLAISIFRDYLKKVVSFFDDRAIIKKNASVYHNPAADNVSLNLYGINKLANDHNIDIVLHVHFNDYPGRPAGSSGKYNGFAIYVPEEQLPNSRVSIALAESVKEALEKYFPVSNFPGEAKGVIQDQELIAVGSNASREGASMLIEYGYIYEPQFTYSAARAIIFKSLAEQTYLGIKNFFETNVLR